MQYATVMAIKAFESKKDMKQTRLESEPLTDEIVRYSWKQKTIKAIFC